MTTILNKLPIMIEMTTYKTNMPPEECTEDCPLPSESSTKQESVALLTKQATQQILELQIASKKETTFDADMFYLSTNFKDNMPLNLQKSDELIKNDVLKKVTTKVTKTQEKFSFSQNGFEFVNFEKEGLETTVGEFAAAKSWFDITDETQTQHSTEVENFFTKWGKQQKIDFSKVVWIDTVYRNTAGGRFGAVHFTHVDFPAKEYSSHDFSSALKGHGATWKDRVVKKLGDMTKDEYEKLNIAKMCNIWIPLDKKLEAEPLAIMDMQTLSKDKSELHVYEDSRAMGGDMYHSVGVTPQEQHRWYIKENMGLGDAVIFDTCQTPHTAVTLPDQGNKTRKSIECRVLFLK
jgi:hypothetical protein